MTITDETVLDCGHTPTTPRSPMTTGYGTDREGKTACFSCSNAQELAAMLSSDSYTAYVDSKSFALTTWPGGLLATYVPSTGGVSNSGWHGSKVYSWRFRAEDGSEWYGRNGGPGMYITVRRAKH